MRKLLFSVAAESSDIDPMNDNLTMSDRMYLRDGVTYGTGTLFRFRASGMPGGDEAFLTNVHSGTPHEPLWRIEGRENWLRVKRHYRGSQIVVDFADGTGLVIDLNEYSPTVSDLLARSRSLNIGDSCRGWR
jgi:hypothetical protein